MLEVEGPTSADAGVTSCLLVNAEPVFRRLRDDLFDEILLVGMIELAVGQTQQVRDDGFLINGSSINDSCSPMSSSNCRKLHTIGANRSDDETF